MRPNKTMDKIFLVNVLVERSEFRVKNEFQSRKTDCDF